MKQAGDYTVADEFSPLYLTLREKEGRLYSDEEVLLLPDIKSFHPYYKEWQMRKKTSARLINYLSQKKKALKILEVGCGNGWLSHHLAAIADSKITGVDINFPEIQQAATVFSEVANLKFLYGDMQSGLFKDRQFDIIIFAAAIQYFPSLAGIINTALDLLKEDGEIHIIDSHFYHSDESVAAKYRTQDYFSKLGLPRMSDWYHHHLITELEKFNYKILYKPSPLFFFQKQNPFPWIVIKSEKDK